MSEEIIWSDVRASFARRPSIASNQARWYNKGILRKGYSVPREFSWIQNYKLMSFDLKHWWNLVLYFFFFFFFFSNCWLGPNFNILLKLRKISACVSTTIFLLKTFNARFYPSRKFTFTKFLQKYGSLSLFYSIERVKY